MGRFGVVRIRVVGENLVDIFTLVFRFLGIEVFLFFFGILDRVEGARIGFFRVVIFSKGGVRVDGFCLGMIGIG